MLVPCVTLVTLFSLGIGIAGTLPTTNKPAQWAIVVFVFLWSVHISPSLKLPIPSHHPYALIGVSLTDRQICFNISIGVCGFAVASEVGSLPLRSHTQAMVGVTQVTSGWIIIFTIPYIINPDAGNLGGRIGYMFFAF